MSVFIVAALVAMFYLCAVPVHVVLRILPDGAKRLGIWLGLFHRTRIWRLNPTLQRPKKPLPKLPNTLMKAARLLVRHTEVDQLDVTLSAGDAFATAILSGLLWSTLSIIAPCAHIRPTFDSLEFRLSATCIVTVHLGYIMLAALYGAWIYVIWRVRTWINGRLKALWPPRWNPFATWWTSTP